MNLVSRAGLTLGLCVLGAITALTITHVLTRERIEVTQQQTLLNTLQSLLPEGPFDNDPIQSMHWLSIDELGGDKPIAVYPVYKNHTPDAAVLSVVAPGGYNGNIHLLVGISANGELIGARVTRHHETPGLGDAIDIRRSDWITAFDGRSLNDTDVSDWAVRSDGGMFDALTGATITSRAIINSIHQVLQSHKDSQERIFAP